MDPITFNVLAAGLTSIPSEMAINLWRAAYSSIVREAKDLSTCLFDREGRAVTQAEQIPILVSALSTQLRGVLEVHPVDSWHPEDCAITNDPYHGGQHLNDIAVFTPIFEDGELIGMAGSIAHHLDLGGITAGIISGATEIFHDGLVLPRLRFRLHRGRLDPMLERILRANMRVPHETVGDLHAQIVANRTAEQRLRAMVRRHGRAEVLAAMEGLLDYAERLTRAQIEAFPDGSYRGEAIMEDDGEGEGPFPVRVTVEIAGSEMLVDFADSAAQARGMINAPFASTLAAVNTAIRHVVGTAGYVPANDGAARPLEVRAPLGSLLNPRPPASVHARYLTAYRVYEAVMDALSKAVPERTTAVGFNSTSCFALAHNGPQGYRILSDTAAGGWGAGPANDGADAVPLPLSNCANVPAEWLEHAFPYLRLKRYEMIPDSCGHGRQRGGLGELREFEVLADDVDFSGMCDRFIHPGKGLDGGSAGTVGAFRIRRGNEQEELPSKNNRRRLRKGDVVQVVTGGGGGYGPPAERPREQVARDLRAGIISHETARAIYGYTGPG
jgi:N-methylhydantoinase B